MLSEQQRKFSTRAMRSEFLQKYKRLAKTPKFILRNICCTLVNDGSLASSSAKAEVDQRVAKAIVDLNDPEIVFDLRSMNEKVKSSHFDAFWNELQYLDEINLCYILASPSGTNQ